MRQNECKTEGHGGNLKYAQYRNPKSREMNSALGFKIRILLSDMFLRLGIEIPRATQIGKGHVVQTSRCSTVGIYFSFKYSSGQ